MKRLVATALMGTFLAAAAAVPAQAGPIQETTCAVYAKIGVQNVQDCNTTNPDS